MHWEGVRYTQALADEKAVLTAERRELEARLQLLLPPGERVDTSKSGVDPAAGNPAPKAAGAEGDGNAAYRAAVVEAAEAEKEAALSKVKLEHMEASNSAKDAAGVMYRQLKEKLEEELARMEIDRDDKVKAAEEAVRHRGASCDGCERRAKPSQA
jgi:hypothetical protein